MRAWEKNWLLQYGWSMAQIETLISTNDQTPVEYLTGWAPFLDLQIQVDRHTLIPRLETEELVKLSFAAIKAKKINYIWEVGTGSGAIACALAKKMQQEKQSAQIFATDISQNALTVADKNLRRLKLEKVITLAQSDLLANPPSWLKSNQPWFLVANLPYLPEFRRQQMDESVKNFEPQQALFAGDDGLSLINKLLNSVIRLEKLPTAIFLEIDASHQLKDFAAFSNYKWQIVPDFHQQNRYALGYLLAH